MLEPLNMVGLKVSYIAVFTQNFVAGGFFAYLEKTTHQRAKLWFLGITVLILLQI